MARYIAFPNGGERTFGALVNGDDGFFRCLCC